MKAGKPKKFNKCPHCKSDKGFTAEISLGGWQYDTFSFSGKRLTSERHGADDVNKFVTCLNCDKNIDLDNVRYNP